MAGWEANDAKCETGGYGHCQYDSNYCPSGVYESNLCGGPNERRCCVSEWNVCIKHRTLVRSVSLRKLLSVVTDISDQNCSVWLQIYPIKTAQYGCRYIRSKLLSVVADISDQNCSAWLQKYPIKTAQRGCRYIRSKLLSVVADISDQNCSAWLQIYPIKTAQCGCRYIRSKLLSVVAGISDQNCELVAFLIDIIKSWQAKVLILILQVKQCSPILY